MNFMIADAHADTLWAAPKQKRLWYERSDEGHVDVPRLIDAGVVLQVMALFSDPAHRVPGYTVKAMDMWQTFQKGVQQARRDGVRLDVVRTGQQLDTIGEDLLVILSIEGGEALGGSLSVLDVWFYLGIRAMGLVWNNRNDLGEGTGKDDSGQGLTRFGKEVVKKMDGLGMIVDVSHLNDAGFWDVANVAQGTFYASHSNARAVCDVPRNLTDEQIEEIAARGGVIGINFHSPFLRTTGRATIDDIVRHIDHISDLVGLEHICLGTDYDGIPQTPIGLEDVTRLPRLAHRLQTAGYAPQDVEKMMATNLIDLFRRTLPKK